MKTIFKSLTAAAALVSAIATNAAAQDAEKWQGFYLGGRVNMQNLEISDVPFGINPEINAGVFGGYNHAVAPNFVIGAELGYDSKLDYTVMGTGLDLENNVSVRGRGGYAFGNSLLYGSLGYGWTDWDVAAAGVSGSGQGISYGVGLETMLTDNITTRFEYTRTSYDFSGPGLGGRDGDVDAFTVGVAYKF
ncbi:hypothetical protein FIU89_12725 [Roseovarius sp. THAF27]|uniref:outer membrane protein n=1 Tax=Roseovarius sp. THAF27 TaxID=2587850 RepID=UPI0012A90B0C|nr:porin family protein [Roseovarius sp. THAF27]QFT81480.1 hypothetical protein FIU89_12725 [Roseovarius sp. THAF27]